MAEEVNYQRSEHFFSLDDNPFKLSILVAGLATSVTS